MSDDVDVGQIVEDALEEARRTKGDYNTIFQRMLTDAIEAAQAARTIEGEVEES